MKFRALPTKLSHPRPLLLSFSEAPLPSKVLGEAEVETAKLRLKITTVSATCKNRSMPGLSLQTNVESAQADQNQSNQIISKSIKILQIAKQKLHFKLE